MKTKLRYPRQTCFADAAYAGRLLCTDVDFSRNCSLQKKQFSSSGFQQSLGLGTKERVGILSKVPSRDSKAILLRNIDSLEGRLQSA